MTLTRFVFKGKDGLLYGVGHFVPMTSDCDLEDEILFHEEYLPVPSPYPENSVAYFTTEGLESNSQLIDLWIRRCEQKRLTILKLECSEETATVLYQDQYQVLICNNSTIKKPKETVLCRKQL